MHGFKNILLVLDSKSKQGPTLERAIATAKACDARLKVIDVVESFHSSKVLFDAPEELEQIILEKQKVLEQVMGRRLSQINELVKSHDVKGLEIKTEVIRGKPYLQIIRQVLKFGFDLVIKNAEGKAGMMWGLLGSDDTQLVRKCPAMVWLLKPTSTKRFKQIVAAVDADPFSNDETEDQLNRKIVEAAVALAQRDKAELHLLHVWDFFPNQVKADLAEFSRKKHEKMVAWEKEKRQQAMARLLYGFPVDDLDYRMKLIKGDPKKEISKVANQFQNALLVMGSVGRTGIPGILTGNTAESVLSQIHCSLLAIKPDGFVSPVTLEEE